MRSGKLVFLIGFFYSCFSVAQNGSSDFLFPIRPNEINTLAGTMGELRTTHFHTGIDIRTGNREGLPVYAIDDGYVTRISVRSGGYGYALYVKHPEGYISVYAHLQKFNKDIAEHVRKEQYKRQKFEINIFPRENQFKVKKGDTIAFSGNSGSSTGPHLHFDLRDKNHHLLDPLSYGFEEVKDDVPPIARRIAFKTLDKFSRINGSFGRFEYRLNLQGDQFVLDDTISLKGKIGIQLYGYDRQNFTYFRTGISKIYTFLDGQKIFEQNIETFSFSDQSKIDVFTDYVVKQETGRSFRKLYIDDGNDLKFLKTYNKGILNFTKNGKHNIRIKMEDTFGNSRDVFIPVKAETSFPKNIYHPMYPEERIEFKLIENILVIHELIEENDKHKAVIYAGQKTEEIEPSYYINDSVTTYLWDMRMGLPDSILVCNSKKYFNFKAMVPSGIEYDFYDKYTDITFSKYSLFDTLYLSTQYFNDTDKEYFLIHRNNVPLRSTIEVTLKPQNYYPDKERTSVYALDGAENHIFVGGKWDGKKIKFNTGKLGRYTLEIDSIAPEIKPLIINNDNLVFRISDDLSGIKEFKATINGKWILMNYDYKTRRIWSEKLDKNEPLKGELELSVIDNSNNEYIYRTKIN